jgi:hypothetical protein
LRIAAADHPWLEARSKNWPEPSRAHAAAMPKPGAEARLLACQVAVSLPWVGACHAASRPTVDAERIAGPESDHPR